MTLKDAKLVQKGTRIKNVCFVNPEIVATAQGTAIINGLHWKIPVDVETSYREGQQNFIMGKRGYCWEIEPRNVNPSGRASSGQAICKP
jgi:hypothetical protein